MYQMDTTITTQNIVEQNELQITLLRTFEFTQYVMRIMYTTIVEHL